MKTLKKLAVKALLTTSTVALFNCTTDSTSTKNNLETTSTSAILTTTRVEAENYSGMSGIRTQTTGDIDGGDNVGWINNGDWVRFADIDLTSNVTSFSARVASATNGGTLELRLDSPDGNLLDQIDISNTGGWQTWETLTSSSLTFSEGIYDIYAVFNGGSGYLFNVNWIEFIVEENNTEIPVLNVDPSLFLTEDDNLSITTVPCTLSDGTETECYQIVSTHTPSDHEMGPWCPENIEDGPEAGGLWIDNGNVYNVDGAFIENLATFYGDNSWQMYDEETGEVNRMVTQEQCQQGADANVEDEFLYMCAQCLPGWINAEVTYLIPITPVKQETPMQLSGGVTEDIPGVEYGPAARGLAFNGVSYAFPAAVDVILEAYQIAPVDHAGGHINNSDGYHYHGDLGYTTRENQTDGHASMIGYALDGHGIYAELDESGNESANLDECRGHDDSTRGYHYHVGKMGDNEIFDCYYGAYAEQQGGGRPPRP